MTLRCIIVWLCVFVTAFAAGDYTIHRLRTMDGTAAKPFIPHSHIPYEKEGTGSYSDMTLCCFKTVSNAQPLILHALDLVPPKEGTPFVICDYGTADGGATMNLFGVCVKAIKEKHGRDKEILVYYEDQPINDFKSVMKRVHGLQPGLKSYAMETPGVYAACVGTNFFDKCFPANTVHLGISFTAMHWLSARPCILTDTIHPLLSRNESEKKLFRQHASHDWETILLARAHELVPGGQMVIVCLAVDENGQFAGNTRIVHNNMRMVIERHWAAMVDSGIITKEEFANTTFNDYFRTMEEFKAPFNDANSQVSQAGLHLVSIKVHTVPCLYHTAWVTRGNKDDKTAKEAHAKWFIPGTRTWSNSTFRSALDTSRSEEEKDKIVDELFARYEAEIAASPEDHAMELVHAYIHIKKI